MKSFDAAVEDGEPLTEAELSDTTEIGTDRNFLVLILYQVLMRVGWIFKTESIIMPAVLDSLGGAAWLRSCLPVINRFWQSIPPVLAASHVKLTKQKKWVMAYSTAVMALSFLALWAVWRYWNVSTTYLAVAFLALYALFFISTGINQLVFATLQGKLVPVANRGRLLLFSNVFGALSAIGCASLLLRHWLSPESSDFASLFFVSGLFFASAAFLTLTLHEASDNFKGTPTKPRHVFRESFELFRADRNFRRLAFVAALFGSSMMLFPHYQALGRQSLELSWDSLITWVMLQNAGTAIISVIIGPIADRCGNRLVLNMLLFGISLAPGLALILAANPALGNAAFGGIFVLVGLTPVAVRMFHNYTLEISAPADHPKYLSTLGLCIAAPIYFSPLLGILVDNLGFRVVFTAVDCLIVIAFVFSFSLREPRDDQKQETLLETDLQ